MLHMKVKERIGENEQFTCINAMEILLTFHRQLQVHREEMRKGEGLK